MGLRFTRALGRSISALIVCAGVSFLSTSAMATPLLPGGAVAPGATASPTGAVLIQDSGLQPFTALDGTSFSGSLRTRVYSNDPGNPSGLNGLTFTFLLANNGPDALNRLERLRSRLKRPRAKRPD